MSQFGKFENFCRDSTLPVCNLFVDNNQPPGSGYGGCELTGITLSGGRNLANLGSILFAFIAIIVTLYLILRTQRKAAAVGRREMQIFLVGFIIIEICEIFSVGGFPLSPTVRKAFSAIHIAAITGTSWVLLINALVGYQLLDDGTPASMALTAGSAAIIAIGTGYIALDVGFGYTDFFQSTLSPPHQAYALYILYLFIPLLFIAIYFILETVLVIKVLGEKRPTRELAIAALLFAIGQVFQFVASVHICKGTNGKINGAMFETLFTLLAVAAVWKFWSAITEDDWPMPVAGSQYP